MQPPQTLAPTRPNPLVSHRRLRSVSGIRKRSIGCLLSARYRLLACLGEGGMGAVWRARDCLLGIDVALKLHSGEVDADAIDALRREATVAARVRHSASVRVLEFAVAHDGTPFIVMDLVRGDNLAEHLRKHGPLPAERAVQIMLPVAGALRAAHRLRVVHCDVKPANIVLLRDGDLLHPYLLDFGIASIRERLREEGGDAAPKAVWGTPPYMSPEQARGEPFDQRSDIWSFCAVLWELLVGRRLFPEHDARRVLRRVARAGKRPLERPEAIEPALWKILERGLHPVAGERWASLDELGGELAGWLTRRGIQQDSGGGCLSAHWNVPSAGLVNFVHGRWLAVLVAFWTLLLHRLSSN